jgi:hypothetical protein
MRAINGMRFLWKEFGRCDDGTLPMSVPALEHVAELLELYAP